MRAKKLKKNENTKQKQVAMTIGNDYAILHKYYARQIVYFCLHECDCINLLSIHYINKQSSEIS